MKSKLKDETNSDVDIIRGSLREIIEHNRSINATLISNFEQNDLSLIEEYNLITKDLLSAAKLLSEVNAQTPKTLQELDKIKGEKVSIDLNDLIDTDDTDDTDDNS